MLCYSLHVSFPPMLFLLAFLPPPLVPILPLYLLLFSPCLLPSVILSLYIFLFTPYFHIISSSCLFLYYSLLISYSPCYSLPFCLILEYFSLGHLTNFSRLARKRIQLRCFFSEILFTLLYFLSVL